MLFIFNYDSKVFAIGTHTTEKKIKAGSSDSLTLKLIKKNRITRMHDTFENGLDARQNIGKI